MVRAVEPEHLLVERRLASRTFAVRRSDLQPHGPDPEPEVREAEPEPIQLAALQAGPPTCYARFDGSGAGLAAARDAGGLVLAAFQPGEPPVAAEPGAPAELLAAVTRRLAAVDIASTALAWGPGPELHPGRAVGRCSRAGGTCSACIGSPEVALRGPHGWQAPHEPSEPEAEWSLAASRAERAPSGMPGANEAARRWPGEIGPLWRV